MSVGASEAKEMVGGRECVCMATEAKDFESAKSVAENKAREIDPGAQLLYWFDRDRSLCSPGVVCTGPEIPEWLTNASKQCDTIPIGVNDAAYFFSFAGSNCRSRASA